MMKYSLQQLLLDIFFPSYCPHCQKAIPGRLLLCEACDRELYAPRFWKPDEESGSHLDGIFRFYHYEGGIKAALHGLKYSKREEYLSRIGEEVLFHRKDLPAFLQDSSAVFALIPTDPTRRAERGYDIPEAIFEPLCRA